MVVGEGGDGRGWFTRVVLEVVVGMREWGGGKVWEEEEGGGRVRAREVRMWCMVIEVSARRDFWMEGCKAVVSVWVLAYNK